MHAGRAGLALLRAPLSLSGKRATPPLQLQSVTIPPLQGLLPGVALAEGWFVVVSTSMLGARTILLLLSSSVSLRHSLSSRFFPFPPRCLHLCSFVHQAAFLAVWAGIGCCGCFSFVVDDDDEPWENSKASVDENASTPRLADVAAPEALSFPSPAAAAAAAPAVALPPDPAAGAGATEQPQLTDEARPRIVIRPDGRGAQCPWAAPSLPR